jgi:hypothetical protein
LLARIASLKDTSQQKPERKENILDLVNHQLFVESDLFIQND